MRLENSLSVVAPGVWRLRLGEPERLTPTSVFPYKPALAGLEGLPTVGSCPIDVENVTAEATPRGYLVSLPLLEQEQVYGLGLQLLSFNQRGKKKTLRVNSDPKADTGDSHAPVPFYVTTSGYGVMIDTLRYLTVYCGVGKRRESVPQALDADIGHASATGADELYRSKAKSGDARVVIEIPSASGIDLYFFAGPCMQQAVQRYNLFSGGGCLPAMWGLGVWYRCKADFNDSAVLKMADYFRENAIPCDVIGLEPGWQSHAYSCSFTWNDSFPQPAQLMEKLATRHFHVNLWEHAFTHPSSPLHKPLVSRSGDQLVWDGLVPDFADPEARRLFAKFHEQTHVKQGASGYKLDECDNSDFVGSDWSFPEYSKFASGLDGEQMHSALGVLYAKTIQGIFEKADRRTYGQVRSSLALAAPLSSVLYSDLYDHQSYIRGVVVSGFSGLLWCPEVRHAESAEDLIRRVQSVVFSPQAVVNAWYIKNPPWEQWERNANNEDRLHADRKTVTDLCRQFFELRMQFLPYLYAAFVDYHRTGTPPFRALVMEDPADPGLWNIDNAYMMGDRVLVAPVIAGVTEIDLYLPKGGWRDFWTGAAYEGGMKHHILVPIEHIPVFVRDNSLLPLAQPAQHADDPALRQLTVRVYGSGEKAAALYEDNGTASAYDSREFNQVEITWDKNRQQGKLIRTGKAAVPGYVAIGWEKHGR
jgi:alpha-D-xyloside xylohydrolase